jgi:hypothetical protein
LVHACAEAVEDGSSLWKEQEKLEEKDRATDSHGLARILKSNIAVVLNAITPGPKIRENPWP